MCPKLSIKLFLSYFLLVACLELGLTIQPTLVSNVHSSDSASAGNTDVYDHACVQYWIIAKPSSLPVQQWSETHLLTIRGEHPAFNFLFICTKFLTYGEKKEGKCSRQRANFKTRRQASRAFAVQGGDLRIYFCSYYLFFYTAARVPRFRFWQLCLPGAAVWGDFQLWSLFQLCCFAESFPPTG